MGFDSQQELQFSHSLSLCFMCSDQHVKYRMSRRFSLTSSLLLNYHVNQYILIITVYIDYFSPIYILYIEKRLKRCTFDLSD